MVVGPSNEGEYSGIADDSGINHYYPIALKTMMLAGHIFVTTKPRFVLN